MTALRANLALAIGLSALSACGSGDSSSTAGPEPQRRAPHVAPPAISGPAPAAAAPGALSGGSMWARGMTGGGGGGGGLARDAFERNRQERLAREGPQRPPSERHDQLVREGQERAAELAAHLPAGMRSHFAEPPSADRSQEDELRDRCTALMEANRQALAERGDRDVTAQAFIARCRGFGMDLWRCVDQGEAGRENPECRQQFGRLDREVRTLRAQGRETADPDQRIDGLANEQWETERDEVAPETLAPETVERPPPVVLD